MERRLTLTEDVAAWLDQHVRPVEPEAGCAVLARTATGRHRRTLLGYRVIQPGPGEVEWREGPMGLGLYFDAEYLARVQNAAIDDGAGVILVHNHPHDPGPTFSGPDSQAEAALLEPLQRATGGPVGALLLGRPGRMRAREWIPDDAGLRPHPIGAVRIAGPHMRVVWTLDANPIEPPTEATDRSILLWGKAGQRILQNLRVAIVGAGGVGSYLAEGLARLGVGQILQIDHDAIEDINITRNAQSTWRDLGKAKVQVLKERLASCATAKEFHYEKIEGRVQDHQEALVDCDVILCAVDGYSARDVVNELAYRHLIGVIDCGTQLTPDGTERRLEYGVLRAQLIGPGRPCLWCTGFLTRERLSEDLMTEEAKGAARYGLPATEAPAVFFTNGMTMGMAGMLFLEHVLHLTGTLPTEARYNVLTWDLTSEQDTGTVGCECGRVYAYGNAEPPPVSTWAKWINGGAPANIDEEGM